MPFSIFSSERLRRTWRHAPARLPWVAALSISFGLTIFGAFTLLEALFIAPAWKSPTARVLMVGTSHLDNAIEPRLLPWDTGVLACAGADLQLLRTAFDVHAARWPNLELVIIEVDEYTLLTDRVRGRRDDLSPLVDRLNLTVWELADRDDEWERLRWRLENLARGRGQAALQPRRRLGLANARWLRDRWLRDPVERPAPTPPPYVPPKPEKVSPEAARTGMGRFEKLVGDPEWNLASLEALVADLTARDIEVVLVTFPSHPNYTRIRPPEWDGWIRTAVERASRAGPTIAHWDLREAPLPEDAFTDLTHLNRRGAHDFTRALVDRIEARTRFGRANARPTSPPP